MEGSARADNVTLTPTCGADRTDDFFGFCQLIAFSTLVAAGNSRLGFGHGRMGVKTKLQAKSLNRCVRTARGAWLVAPLAAVIAIAAPAQAKSSSTATSFDYKSWDQYAGGADSSQYSSLDQVNTGNVKDLQVAWTFETGPGQAPHFNPIKIGDTLY